MARPIEKREHIENGVVQVIARKGLRGTTIQDIADAANVSPGLLYRYWKNRDDLAADVYRTHFLELTQRLAGLAAAESEVFAKLRVLVRAFLQFADEQPVLLKFLLLSQHDLAQSVPPEKSVRALMSRVLEEGMAQGRVRRMSLALAVQMFLGLVLQPAVGAAYGHISTPVSRHEGVIMDGIERLLKPECPPVKSKRPESKQD